jgi:hypothetical protein
VQLLNMTQNKRKWSDEQILSSRMADVTDTILPKQIGVLASRKADSSNLPTAENWPMRLGGRKDL